MIKRKIIILFFIVLAAKSFSLTASQLYIGTASADITPPLPVALTGQFHLRVANIAETPLTANIVALESRKGDTSIDMVIMVSCDLLYIPNEMLNNIRHEVKRRIPELDVMKIFLSATHTHTAPVLENDLGFSFRYQINEVGITQVAEYNSLVVQRVSEAIVKAWENRNAGSVTWGYGHAAVGYNRRVIYADGTAQMYGNTNRPEFMNFEGMDDHDINTLFFWNNQDELIALCINVACPSQEVEARSTIHADFWHPVREKLRERFGPDLITLGWAGASGDISPRPMYRRSAEERMMSLRNLNRLEEIARRIVVTVEDIYEVVNEDRRTDVQLIHKTENLHLPKRIVTEGEYLFSKSERDKFSDQIAENPNSVRQVLARKTWNEDVIRRYKNQQLNPHQEYISPIHIVRIGDIAIATNQFEFFSDYGIRIQARSDALQTFIITFAGPITYLPTAKAVKGGGYSAVVQSGVVGPEAGQILVDRTIEIINEMFK